MKELFKILLKKGWHFQEKSNQTKEHIKNIENVFSLKLPKDYKQFIKMSNGGEGWINETYLDVWNIETIIPYHSDYEFHKYLNKNIIAFGTDGSDNVWAFSYEKNKESPKVIKFSFGDMDMDEIEKISDSFSDFLIYLLE